MKSLPLSLVTMPEYLIVRLYGPLASWGGIAVGQYRPAENHPSMSGVLGLVAAALGVRREDAVEQAALRESYQMAALVHAEGTLLRDYHTTQVPSATVKKRAWPFATRREELSMPRDHLNTILSSREYYCDVLATVALWPTVDDPPYSLAEIAEALRHPAFVPYLGRKSCPLALPLMPQVVEGADLHEACDAVQFPDQEILSGIPGRGDSGTLFWDGEGVTGFESKSTYTAPKRDVPLDRMTWQFAERDEHQARVLVPEGVR